jgi:hypothetical protein
MMMSGKREEGPCVHYRTQRGKGGPRTSFLTFKGVRAFPANVKVSFLAYEDPIRGYIDRRLRLLLPVNYGIYYEAGGDR